MPVKIRSPRITALTPPLQSDTDDGVWIDECIVVVSIDEDEEEREGYSMLWGVTSLLCGLRCLRNYASSSGAASMRR